MINYRFRTRLVCLLLGALISAVSSSGTLLQRQEKEERNPRFAHLALIAKSSLDSVILRWAPSRPGGWSIANDLGYIVERIRVNTDGSFDPVTFERLTAAPLKPWSLDEWKRQSTTGNHFGAVAAQALYGKMFVPKSPDNGGLNALRNAADEFANRYSFALFCADNDALTANALALRLVDNNVHAGEKYVYRVFVGGVDSTYSFDTTYTVVRIEPSDLPPRVHLLGEGFDGRIVLRWKQPIAQTYSGYYVFRSDDEGKSYRKMNTTPLVATVPEGSTTLPEPRYTDTSIVNYRRYRYQVRGVTPFAELGPPGELEVWGRDRTPPAPPQVQRPVQKGKNTIELQWDVPEASGDLHGFVVARSASSFSGFHELIRKPLPSSARAFLDMNATDAEPYYVVGAVDTAGNVALSLPVFGVIVDSLPPAAPMGLGGTIDSNGVVRLRWKLGPESDIIGYRVFRSNAEFHEFAQVTPGPIKDTTYLDTIATNTLTNAVYYSVIAVDNRYNHSGFSATLTLRRPDRIPPESPVFKDIVVGDSSVHLTWIPSPSADVESQLLYRRFKGEEKWVTLATKNPIANDYVDHTVSSRRTYQYMLVAEDSSGLRSVPAMPIEARPYDTGVRTGVDTIVVSYDGQRRSALISWRYASPPKERFYFAVYRATGMGSLKIHGAVGDTARSFEDTAVQPGKSYRYAVKVITSNGGESPISSLAYLDAK
jgi:uncharacterized protein